MNRVSDTLNRLVESAHESILKFIGTQETLSVQLDITNACNLKCTHCYQSEHGKSSIKLEEWKSILLQYRDLLNKLKLKPRIILCGGEPTTSPILKPMLELLKDLFEQVPITLLTNGTLVTDAIVKLCLDYKIEVQVSLDGHNQQANDAIRGEGSFNKAVLGINKLTAHRIKTSVLITLSKRTSTHIDDFFKLASELKVSDLSFTRLIREGQAEALIKEQCDSELSPLEIKAALIQIDSSSKRHGVETNQSGPLWVLIDEKYGSNGRWGYQSVVVDHQGNLKPSSRIDFILGNVLKEGFENLFMNHPIMESLRNGEVIKCGECQFYSQCGGNRNAAYATYGNILEKDPGCWI